MSTTRQARRRKTVLRRRIAQLVAVRQAQRAAGPVGDTVQDVVRAGTSGS